MRKFFLLTIALLSTQFCAFAMLSKEADWENERVIQGKPKQAVLPTINSAKEKPLTQEKINQIVCATAVKVFDKINKYWIYPEPKAECEVSSKYWKTTSFYDQHNHVISPSLILRPEYAIPQLIEALDDLINNTAVLDCRLAQETVQLFCIKEILGEDDFRTYLTTYSDMIDKHKARDTYDFFKTFNSNFMETVHKKEIPGSIKYIANISEYALCKPHGSARGLNLFCVGNDQYIGFSEIYETGPQPLKKRIQEDFQFFCESTNVEKQADLHSSLCQSFEEEKEKFITLHSKAQNNFYLIFDVQALKNVKKQVPNFRKEQLKNARNIGSK